MQVLSTKLMLLQQVMPFKISAVTPADSHDPVIYPIGIIKKYDNALAKDFYQYVMSPEGQKVLEKYGFSTSK